MLFRDLPCHLKEHFDSGRKYLVCTRRQAWIADETTVFSPRPGGKGATFVVLDLPDLWAKFCGFVDGKGDVDHDELKLLTRLNDVLIHQLERESAVWVCEGRYDLQSAFSAVVASVLYRQQVPYRICVKAAKFTLTGEGASCTAT